MISNKPFPHGLSRTLYRFLSIAARGETPAAQALQVLGNDSPTFGRQASRLKKMGANASQQLRLSALLASQPSMFFPATTALVAQAEDAGKLVPILDALADDAHCQQVGLANIEDAFAWPIKLTSILLLLVGTVSIYVLPAFQEVFNSFAMALPWQTQVLLDISKVVESAWWILLPLLVALVLAVRLQCLPRFGVDMFLKAVCYIPTCKRFSERQFGARLVLWVAALRNDRPLLLAALLHLQRTSRVPQVRQAAAGLAIRLQAGEALTQALASTPMVPPSLVHASHIEQGGQDPVAALELCRELTREQAAVAGEQLGRVLFLVSYTAVGALVGFFVVAVYLPIFRLGTAV